MFFGRLARLFVAIGRKGKAMASYLFSSESVGAGHPDKIADQISDAVLDALIRQTPKAKLPALRCACETMVKTGMVIVSGEIRSDVMVDIETLVRDTVRGIGYDRAALGFDGSDCAVVNIIGGQSADIAQGVDNNGAGDQGIMFGYACRETAALMPLPVELAHQLMRRHAAVRRAALPWLGPDAKAQVSVRYENGRPTGIEAVVLSSQHDDKIDGRRVKDNDGRIRRAVIEHIIKPTLGKWKMPAAAKIFINPTGRFVVGGPKGDCGLTGRKIIVDTYGGAAPHGGGAFSGKDPTKVDRSAAYMMRYIAKNIVAARLAEKCLVQAAYAIGVAEPVSLMVKTEGTAKMPEEEIERRIRQNVDLTPAGIIRALDLWRPIYQKTAAYGHFGRTGEEFSWEKTGKISALLG